MRALVYADFDHLDATRGHLTTARYLYKSFVFQTVHQ